VDDCGDVRGRVRGGAEKRRGEVDTSMGEYTWMDGREAGGEDGSTVT
jgi:hypothetical protein